jgi:pimeloyl-ACP methyl ester carboxylesterase
LKQQYAPQSALDDLKRRLSATRWPEHETVTDWSQGAPLAKLRTLVDYWRTDYDYWHELDRGGHFAAFEQPALFTQELRACFRSLR